MARYVKELPMVDSQASTFSQIQRYLTGEGYEYRSRDGEQVFQKGKGVWTAARFVKVTYAGTVARVEAWVDVAGGEQNLDGFVAIVSKNPLKKDVEQIEKILSVPGNAPVQSAPQDAGAFCSQCGAPMGAEKFCQICGAPAVVAMQHFSSYTPEEKESPIPAGVKVSKKEYFRKYASESFYSNLKFMSIIAYVLVGIVMLTALVNPVALLDAALLLVLSLGMHICKSKGCVIGIFSYACLSALLSLLAGGGLSGWGWIAIGAYGLILFNNEEKRYRQLMLEE